MISSASRRRDRPRPSDNAGPPTELRYRTARLKYVRRSSTNAGTTASTSPRLDSSAKLESLRPGQSRIVASHTSYRCHNQASGLASAAASQASRPSCSRGTIIILVPDPERRRLSRRGRTFKCELQWNLPFSRVDSVQRSRRDVCTPSYAQRLISSAAGQYSGIPHRKTSESLTPRQIQDAPRRATVRRRSNPTTSCSARTRDRRFAARAR